MINRTRFEWDYNSLHKNVEIKQIYARIYVKSINKIVIVSKDGKNWQMPWWKPERWETIFETLQREVYEETSINILGDCNFTLFWYYLVEEDWVEYLQLRYFMEIDNIDIGLLKPSEKNSPDSIKFVKLVTIKEIKSMLPWIDKSWEFTSILKLMNVNQI